MNLKELYAQLRTFSNLADKASNDEDKARFTKLKEIYYNKIAGRPERERKIAEIDLQQRKDRLIARVTNSGIKYNDWIEWANSLYEITPEFKVISHAAKWKNEMSWQCDSDIGCLERIETLIGYKIADRKRGIGDEDKDLAT